MADCSLNGLSTAAKCFDCLSRTEKARIKAFLLATALKGLGGPDFTSLNVRRKAIACFNCLPDFRLDSMDVVVAQRMALNAGQSNVAGLPLQLLRQLVKCTPCGDTWAQYDTDIMWLRCQINKFIGTGAQ